MKLLLDENLSRKLAPALQAEFPGSSHVSLLGLEQADDKTIWGYARDHDFVIVTKDDDFLSLLALHGPPPKIIRLRIGNCASARVLATLIVAAADIGLRLADRETGLVELF